MASGSGIAEWQGSQLSIGASGAYRYVNVYETSFNQSTGVTTVYYNIGTWVNYGNFYSSIFQSWGTFGNTSYTVTDASGNAYDWHQGSATVAYNGSIRFQEGCGFNSYSYGWVESILDLTWTPVLPTYTISYSKNTTDTVNNMPSSQSRKWSKADEQVSSKVPTRTGYTFAGWNTNSTATGTNYASGSKIAWGTANANITLYAKWKKNSWQVTYSGNGATGGSTASQTKTYNDALTLRANGFTRTGFEFKRWNTKTDDTGTAYAASGSYTGNAALSLYAIWNRTVSYSLNGASGTAPASQTGIATSALTLAASQTRSGYAFKQWNTASNDTGTAYQAGGSYPANVGSATLYAIWNPYVTYDANGGSGAPSAQEKTYGTPLTIMSSTPTRSGFTFNSWNTEDDASGTAYNPGGSFSSETSTKLYAIWNATLSYNANGGTGAPASQVGRDGTDIVISATIPTRTGYTFLGWAGSSSASEPDYQPGDEYDASDGNAVLYAVWRCDIKLDNVTCSLVDANGVADPLGKYVKVTADYDATTSGHAVTDITAAMGHSGVTDWQSKTTGLGTSGSVTFTFGPYSYSLFDPHGGYHAGILSATNSDGEISTDLDIGATQYRNPIINSVSTFRTENVGGVYEASDDGTSLGIEVSYAVFSCATQDAPSEIGVVVKNSSGTTVATRTFSGITGATGVARLDVYHDSSFPEDVIVGGELIAADDSYNVYVSVSDAFSDVVTDAKAKSTDFVTIAYFTMDFLGDAYYYNKTEDTSVDSGKTYYTRTGSGTFESPYVYEPVASPTTSGLSSYYEANGARPGHGVAVGKPATREGLDVGTDAFFDSDVSIVGDLSAYDGTFAGGISAASGTFTGGVSASTGTFSDDVSSSGEVSATDQNDVVHNLTEKADAASYLPLSGGEMTGKIVRKSSSLDLTAADNGLSSNWNPVAYHIQDKNDLAMGYLQWYASSAGYTYVSLDARNDGTGSNVTNQLQLRVNNDGTRQVTVSDAAPWRTALGLGTIATAGSADYLKRQPSGTSELPEDTATGSGYPIVLSNSFANSGVVSYMTAANFRTLIGVSAKPTQLYNSTSGSSGTITLSQTAANFNHLRIFYRHNSDNTYFSVDVYSPNSKLVLLPIVEATSSAAWIVGRLVQISGTSVSTYNNWYGEQNTTTGASYNHTNYVNIVRVEGWND